MLNSLKNRLIFTFASLLICSHLFMFLLITTEAKDMVSSYIKSSTVQTMDQYTTYVDTVNEQVEKLAILIFHSDAALTWMNAQMDSAMPYELKQLASVQLMDYLTRTIATYPVVSSATVYHKNGVIVGESGFIAKDTQFTDAAWYLAFKEKGQRWVSEHADPYQPSSISGEKVVSLIFPLGGFEPSQTQYLLKINVSSAMLQKSIKNIRLGSKGTLTLMDWDGNPLSSENAENMNELKKGIVQIKDTKLSDGMLTQSGENGTNLVFYKTLKNKNWVLMGLVSEKDLYRKIDLLKYSLLIITCILLVGTAFIATWFSFGITKPLSGLVLAMRYMERGEFNQAERLVPKNVSIKNEVGFAIHTFDMMIKQVKKYIQNEFELNLRRKGAEYKALLMQINPHFLNNTLELISSLNMQSRKDDVNEVIEYLGSMLRYALDIQSDLVRLKDELQYIEYYMGILKIRFSERLAITLEGKESVGHVKVVKFIMQPIVENAVKYSLQVNQIAQVSIHVQNRDGIIVLQVSDNGCGMTDELKALLLDRSNEKISPEVLSTAGENIGLRNVLARCYLHYGDRFDVTIDSKIGEGTTLTLMLPIGG